MRIRTKISISHIVSVLLSLALLALLLALRFEALFMDNLRGELHKQAFGIAAVVKAGNYRDVGLGPLVKSLSVRFGSRITLVDASGKVLADSQSDVPKGNPLRMPEIRKALAGDFGEDLRKNDIDGQRMFYVAAPVEPLAGHFAVVRVGVLTTTVDETLRNIPMIAFLSFLAVAVVAAMLSLWLTRTVTDQISKMTSFAKSLSGGALSERAAEGGGDEFSDLSKSLNRMAGSLESTIKELSSEKNKLELIVNHIADGILLLNPEGRVLLANPAARKILKLSGDEIVGRKLGQVVYSRELQNLVKGCLAEQCACELELKIGVPANYLMTTALPLMGEAYNDVGSLIILQNKTRQRRLDKMRRDFVANVSHELKTPITGLKLVAETLVRSIDDAEAVRRFSRRLLTDMDRLSHLIDDLLVLSSLEAPEKKPENLMVDVAKIACEVVQCLSELANEKGIGLMVSTDGDRAKVMGDPRLIYILIENIIENAVKYTQEGCVDVKVEEHEGKVMVSVIDTGPGIAEKDIHRVFERFYRVDKDRSRATGGTGLGLSIAKHIATNLGADIRIESSLGQGSTFRIEFSGVQSIESPSVQASAAE